MQPPARALSVADTLRSLVQKGDVHLPAVPDVTLKLQELLGEEDRADSHKVAAIIATEPAIAASTLRLANSVAFGGLREVVQLDEAVSRVGMRQVASLATTIATRGAFKSKNPARALRLTELWTRSLIAAVTTRRLALGQTDPEEAYLAGLMHDVGKPLTLKLLDTCEKHFVEPLTTNVIDELLEAMHVELGHKLLQAWRIPESICEVTLRHHDAKPTSNEILLARVQAGDAVAMKGNVPDPPEFATWSV